MKKPKIYKYFIFSFILTLIFAVLTYSLLTNRHKAIVKTTLLHQLYIVNNHWNIDTENATYKMESPTFLIDGIYKSMEGPKSSRYVQINQDKSVLWITGFKVEAFDVETNKKLSNDFICHTNVDMNDVAYYTNWNLEDRIGKQYPRLTSLSNGFEQFHFPKGYGVPIKSNDYLNITSQALNHNHPTIFKKIKHVVSFQKEHNSGVQKPLLSKTVYILLPFDQSNPYKDFNNLASNECIPIETKNHTYLGEDGKMLSGHWIIPQGKSSYKSAIKEQLQIKDSLRLHFSAIHVHPFATKISLYDVTSKKYLFQSEIINYKDKIGLQKVSEFSSEKGIWMYKTHDYELHLEVDNTSSINQDMMGSMFLFFYDQELDEIIKKTTAF